MLILPNFFIGKATILIMKKMAAKILVTQGHCYSTCDTIAVLREAIMLTAFIFIVGGICNRSPTTAQLIL
jgi:hypothetical protein